MKSKLLVIDISKKQSKRVLEELSSYITDNDQILSITPYSCYLLDLLSINYKTYQEVVDTSKYLLTQAKSYDDLKNCIEDSSTWLPLRYDIFQIVSYWNYIMLLIDYLEEAKKNLTLVYIRDEENNNTQDLYLARLPQLAPDLFEQQYQLKSSLKFDGLYHCLKVKGVLRHAFPSYKKFKQLFIKIVSGVDLKYDNKRFGHFYANLKPFSIKNKSTKWETDYQDIVCKMQKSLVKTNVPEVVKNYYNTLCLSITSSVTQAYDEEQFKLKIFTFLSGAKEYVLRSLFLENKIPILMMQHGSYLHENMSLISNEILPADVNFVFNDYTKDLFIKRGAINVQLAYSEQLNYKVMKHKNYKYDFLYIAYCSAYAYTGSVVPTVKLEEFADSTVMYKRHKFMIEIFGKSFTHYTLCIKVLPNFLNNGLYVPLLELASKYKNITIEYIKPVAKLVNQCRNIISDYYSSDFINRELHFVKDIILFSNLPFKIEEVYRDKLAKMFILCESEEKLVVILNNFKRLTTKRLRHPDIIDYFSSKPKKAYGDTLIAIKDIYRNADLDIEQ